MKLNSGCFKKGIVPWNKGKGQKRIKYCLICNKEIYGYERKKYCSKKCLYKALSEKFKGHLPYYKGKEKIRKICRHCGKEFYVQVYLKDKEKFCSRRCYAEHKKIPIEKVCKQCGEEFVVSPSLERLKFCSHKCYWKNLEGKPNFALRKRITIQCKICNKKMDVPLNLSNKKYCSRKCKDISLIGKRVSPQTEFQKGIHSKEKHYNWRGGISKEPYPFDFDDELKELIRKRDNYKCQLCSVPQEECLKKLSIHHIDYDKSNLDPKNLMSLCNNCNLKVNHNREYWTNFFQNKLLEIK